MDPQHCFAIFLCGVAWYLPAYNLDEQICDSVESCAVRRKTFACMDSSVSMRRHSLVTNPTDEPIFLSLGGLNKPENILEYRGKITQASWKLTNANFIN